MDKQLIEKYKQEMLEMYRKSGAGALPVMAKSYNNKGELIVSVTTIRGLYPVPGAKVTVFTGDIQNIMVIDTSITDENGKSKIFLLEAPDRIFSQSADSGEPVYTIYNVLVQADGYVDEVNLNLPIFRGVTSLQTVDLTLASSSNGSDTIINDQNEEYNL